MRYTRRKFKRTYRKTRTGRKRSYSQRLAKRERRMTDTLTRNIDFNVAAGIIIEKASTYIGGNARYAANLEQLWIDSARLLLDNTEFKHLKVLYDEFQINSLNYTIMNGDEPTWGGPHGFIGYIISTCTDRNGVTFTGLNAGLMNMGPDILTYGSCKTMDPITSTSFGVGYNFQKHRLSNSIYASTIIEKQTYLPTTQAHMLPSGNNNNYNVMAEQTKMQYLGNAFLPMIGVQVNINRDITDSEVSVNFPILIKGRIQITFRGSRNSSNSESYAYSNPFRPAEWNPQQTAISQTILPLYTNEHVV